MQCKIQKKFQKSNRKCRFRKCFKNKVQFFTSTFSSRTFTYYIKTNIIGISGDDILNYNSFSEDIWENIYINSDTIINLIDVPGCKKFIKTTLIFLFNKRQSSNIDAINII